MKTRKGLKITALVLAVLVLVYGVVALWPRSANFKPENPMMKTGDMPLLIAHGGGNREFPDNTLEAFYNAYSVDKNVMMETDVSITKDGVVILSHDISIDRKTNFLGLIEEWTYVDLMLNRVDFGYENPVEEDATGVNRLSGDRKKFQTDEGKEVTPLDVTYPEGVSPRHPKVFMATTLEELIVAFPDNRINVEIKQPGETGLRAVKAVVELLKKHDAFDRVVLASFHDEIYNEYKRMQKAGEVPENFMYSPGIGGAATFYILQMLGLDNLYRDGMCVFQLPTEEYGFKLATKGLITTAHKHNLAVHYWTINEPEEMRMLISLGADGIMTDYPHRLKDVYDSYQ